MPGITVEDGKIVVRDGQIGTEQECCCGEGGVCCGPDCGTSFPVDFIPDEGMEGDFTAFLEGRGYANVVYSQDDLIGSAAWSADCCKTDGSDTASFTVTGTVGGVPNSTVFTVPLCITTKSPGSDCVEGLTEQECIDLSGTPNPASSCSPDPCDCDCLSVCENTSIRATYQGETLAIGGSKQNGGNLLTEGRESWSFDCGTFETIDENGSSYTFDGLIFSYEKILVDCEEEWGEFFFLSCSEGQWTADIYRRYIDREVTSGSACNDEFAPPCEQYWFNVPVSVGSDCLPIGDVAASGAPDIEQDNGGTACGGGTFGTLTLSHT